MKTQATINSNNIQYITERKIREREKKEEVTVDVSFLQRTWNACKTAEYTVQDDDSCEEDDMGHYV